VTVPGRAAAKAGLDLGAQDRLVGFDRQQVERRRSPEVVGPGGLDCRGDGGVGCDGVDGDERAAQPVVLGEPGQQHRDGCDLAGLVGHGLLAEHQAAGGGERRDEVERGHPFCAVMAAARGLAIDGDELRASGPGLAHPGGEGGRERGGVDAVHEDGEPAPAGGAVLVGQVAAQEAEVGLAPCGDVVVVVAVGHGGADHEQQDLD